MPRLRFSVSTLILGVLIASLIFALIYQVSNNTKLCEDNKSMRQQLGLPSEMVPGKFFVSRVTADLVFEENSRAWRVILPEGEQYRLLVQSKDIPARWDRDFFAKHGKALFQIGPGETLIHATIVQDGAKSTLIVERNRKPIEFKFDGRFLVAGSQSGTVLTMPWRTPPRRLELYRTHTEDPKKIHDIDGIPHAEVGLQIWLERIDDEQDSSPE